LCEYKGSPKPLGHISLACEETSSAIVRGVWFDGESACPSCRRAAAEQRAVEHPDPLRILPQLLACDCGSAWLDPAGTPSKDSRKERLAELGNAVVPQVVTLIGNAILEAERTAA
jgi:site-specific DNA-cytosine methylase